jgi:hypothetical protein
MSVAGKKNMRRLSGLYDAKVREQMDWENMAICKGGTSCVYKMYVLKIMLTRIFKVLFIYFALEKDI